ncbi:MAG: ribosome biogenesis GTP-binding protein YihA/YsxC [Candidatus Marithrix sp.]
MKSIYRQASYLLSADKMAHLPKYDGIEVAFAGRSNAGKSSAINAITDQKSLARTSKTPGRTQQIIFFQLNENRYLVDLPGYGFAKVSKSVKDKWQKFLANYLQTRSHLHGLVLMMDVRHPLTEFDQQMLEWCRAFNMPGHVLLTKADKISRNKGTATLQQVTKYLSDSSADISVQLFSALKKTGIEEVHNKLNGWLD